MGLTTKKSGTPAESCQSTTPGEAPETPAQLEQLWRGHRNLLATQSARHFQMASMCLLEAFLCEMTRVETSATGRVPALAHWMAARLTRLRTWLFSAGLIG